LISTPESRALLMAKPIEQTLSSSTEQADDKI